MPVQSSVNMAAPHPWDNVAAEYPTKFNKYKRLLASRHANESNNVEVQIPRESLAMHNGNHIEMTRLAVTPIVSRQFHNHHTPPTNHSVPSPQSYRPIKNEQNEDMSDMPLNLTVTSGRNNNLPLPQSPALRDRPAAFHPQSSRPAVCASNITEYDSHIVDEHFQRSLGSVYATLRSGQTPPSSSRSSPKCLPSREPSDPDSTSQGRVSVTGSVDEHFSKSLGDLWTKVKSTSPPSAATAEAMDCDEPSPISVDDHFAKALGDTWLKMQARGSTVGLHGGLISSSKPNSPRQYNLASPR